MESPIFRRTRRSVLTSATAVDWRRAASLMPVLGVDCESIRPLRPGVLHRSFSPDESRFVLESPVPDESFFRLWTLKESFVKALGIGISYPLHTAVFALDGETVTAHPDGWQFRQFRLESGHVVSCCVSPGDTLPAFPEHIAI